MAATKLKVLAAKTTGIENLIDDYLAHQRGRGLSERSKQQMRAVLKGQLLPWCAKNDVTKPEHLTQRTLDLFAAELLERRNDKGEPLARETVRTYIRVVSMFIRWAQSEEAITGKVKLSMPSRQKRLLDVLSREEITRMENVAVSERDRLIIRVLADTGIRLGELLGLHTTDLVEQGGRKHFLKVLGKGSRERLVPITPAMFQRIRKYAAGRPSGAKSALVFLTTRRSKKTGDYEPVRDRSVQNAISAAAAAAGIERSVYPHLFRHAYATWALRQGMNPLQLQQILGHADLTMISAVYSHLTPTDAHAAMMAALRGEDA